MNMIEKGKITLARISLRNKDMNKNLKSKERFKLLHFYFVVVTEHASSTFQKEKQKNQVFQEMRF